MDILHMWKRNLDSGTFEQNHIIVVICNFILAGFFLGASPEKILKAFGLDKSRVIIIYHF